MALYEHVESFSLGPGGMPACDLTRIRVIPSRDELEREESVRNVPRRRRAVSMCRPWVRQ